VRERGHTARFHDPFASLFPSMGQLMAFPSMGGASGGSTYSYSSSYTSSSGPNGVTYQESKSTRMGPGGVRIPNDAEHKHALAQCIRCQ
jgi:hypothetical protein